MKRQALNNGRHPGISCMTNTNVRPRCFSLPTPSRERDRRATRLTIQVGGTHSHTNSDQSPQIRHVPSVLFYVPHILGSFRPFVGDARTMLTVTAGAPSAWCVIGRDGIAAPEHSGLRVRPPVAGQHINIDPTLPAERCILCQRYGSRQDSCPICLGCAGRAGVCCPGV